MAGGEPRVGRDHRGRRSVELIGSPAALYDAFQVSEFLLHRQSDAETRLVFSDDLETTCGIKVFRMWIATDMQGGCALCACKLTAMFDQ
jgi:hypothetical protein